MRAENPGDVFCLARNPRKWRSGFLVFYDFVKSAGLAA